jgi:hemolysin activation/secretion protein
MESVRGYREFEAVGDEAVHANIEIVSPPVPQLSAEHIRRSLRFVAFYDMAYLWLRKPLPGQMDRRQLEGTGVGLRFALSDHLRFRYDAAWALRQGPFTPEGGFYGHFSLEAVF